MLHLRDGRRVTVTAVSGGGVVLDAWRNADAATEGAHIVRHASDAAPGAQGIRSGATDWAVRLRVLVRDAPASAEAVQRSTNAIVLVVTVIASLLGVVAIGLL